MREVEKKQQRMQARSVEPKPAKRLPKAKTRTSVETSGAFKDSRSTLVSLEPVEESAGLSPRSQLDEKSFATVTHTPLSPFEHRSFATAVHTPVSQLRDGDLSSVLIPETTSEGSETEGRGQPRPIDETISVSPDVYRKIRIQRYSKDRQRGERLPPPSIPYSTRSGDVLSVHIVGSAVNRKQSLDLHRVPALETPASLAREHLSIQSRDTSLPRKDFSPVPSSKATSKASILPITDGKQRGRRLSPGGGEDPPEYSNSPIAQYHVFRDISLDQYCLL